MPFQSSLVLNRQAVREVDRRAIRECGMSGLVLMENAGRGVVDALERRGLSGPVVVCCGKGNNGGDGFVIARHLDLRGYDARVLMWSDPADLTGDAAANLQILRCCDVPVRVVGGDGSPVDARDEFRNCAWIVDALLGTGATGEPRPPFDRAIEAIIAAGAPVLAVDVPSGLDCDTGAAASTTIRARLTCTFVALKPGFLVPGAERFTGDVEVLDIGAPRRLIEEIARQENR